MTQKDRDNGIMDTVLDLVGNTPVVRLNRVGANLDCELVAKLEFFNPGGSVKDRIGKRMMLDAVESGRLKPGDTVCEPTSGNTGVGLALSSAVLGYNCIVAMPEKMSKEKRSVLKALGGRVIRTPNSASWDSPDSHITVCENLRKANPQSHHILDQYINPGNPTAHEEGTAEEIYRQCGGKLDMLVAGAGTGGTVSGTARALKKKLPNLIVVAVDPDGSLLHDPENAKIKGYEVEGIGYDFVPQVMDHSVVDKWEVINDQQAFSCARRMIREEGLLCGGSSGTALAAALRAAKTLKKGQRCLIICPDSIRNYLTKFVDDEWCRAKGLSIPAGGTEERTEANQREVDALAKKDAPANGASAAQPTSTSTLAVGLVALCAGIFLGTKLCKAD